MRRQTGSGEMDGSSRGNVSAELYAWRSRIKSVLEGEGMFLAIFLNEGKLLET